MKKLLLTAAVTASFATSAYAADLPAKARPMAPAPVAYAASWTGCYIGGGGGYGMYNQEISSDFGGFTAIPGGRSRSEEITIGGRGWFGTVQAGCDYQFADRFVFGVFGDVDWSGMRGNTTWPRTGAGGFPGGGTFLAEERHDYSWAVGARLGYVVVPGLLAYVAGGYTEATFDGMSPFLYSFPQASGITSTNSLPAATYKGWFIGTGYEYGISFLPGLFWKTEYRFSSFDAQELPFANNTSDFLHSQKYIQTIRSALVWRFNFGGGPVVARY